MSYYHRNFVNANGNLRCSGCSRDATSIPTGVVKMWNDQKPKQRAERSWRQHLLCNVHAGARKRRTWGDNIITLMTDESALPVVAAARKEAEEADAAEREDQKQKATEAQKRYEENRAHEWETYAEEYKITFKSEPTWAGRVDREFRVSTGSGRNWDAFVLAIEDRDKDKPVYVRTRSTGSMTPAAARTLAQALIEAAQMAEDLTAAEHGIDKEEVEA